MRFLLEWIIQANIYLIFEGRNGVSRLFPNNKLQTWLLPNLEQRGIFAKKSNIFDGLCLLSHKSLGFSLNEISTLMGGEYCGQKAQEHQNTTQSKAG